MTSEVLPMTALLGHLADEQHPRVPDAARYGSVLLDGSAA